MVRGSRREVLGGVQRRAAPLLPTGGRREARAATRCLSLYGYPGNTGGKPRACEVGDSAAAAHHHYPRCRSRSDRAIDLARRAASTSPSAAATIERFMRMCQKWAKETGSCAGFLGQTPHDRPDVLEVRDAGAAGWVRGAHLEKHAAPLDRTGELRRFRRRCSSDRADESACDRTRSAAC